MDALQTLYKFYPEDTPLRRLLLHHSRQVAGRALLIARQRPELRVDAGFTEAAALLHDVGIFLTDAPAIHCHGKEPYLIHGYLGGRLMRAEGLPAIARVCERHTGTGLTRQDIAARRLPIPPADYVPETLEEKLVCYADKFYSKSHPGRERTIPQAAESIEKFGAAGAAKFLEWAELFEPERYAAETPA